MQTTPLHKEIKKNKKEEKIYTTTTTTTTKPLIPNKLG
jgi:hypothetical protein